MEERIENLQKRTIKFLEKTKNKFDIYIEERRKLDSYLRKVQKDTNIKECEEWETLLVNSENKLSKYTNV